MTVIFSRGPGSAVRSGGTLTGELSYRADGKKPATRTWQPAQFDPALAAWFAEAGDGARVEIFADLDSDGRLVQMRMAHPPLISRATSDEERIAAVDRLGGGVNPYTFIPTPPRDELPAGLDDAAPAPHGFIDTSTQWSGWLVLRLVTRTPLLLPDPETVSVDADKHPTYAVRLGTDGRPLLHGASVKGALRSAYETVTASRYGVFRGHERVLAYRRPASKEDRPQVTPARVESDGRGGLRFRECTLLPVPLYDPPPARRDHHTGRHKARAIGDAVDLIEGPDGTVDWHALHGLEVTFSTREVGSPPRTRTVIDKVALATDTGSGVTGDVRRGWLSITGRSIEQKASERLFVPTGKPVIPVTADHHVLWNAVLASYHDAAQYNDPGLDKAEKKLDRSSHVVVDGDVPTHLAEGDLVYLDIGQATQAVTAIHPVMIGASPTNHPRPNCLTIP